MLSLFLFGSIVMKPKVRRIKIIPHNEYESHIIRVVGDGLMANEHVGNGCLIPLVILDTINRPDLVELIRVHKHFPPGDTNIQWGRFNVGTIALILSFHRPSELIAIIEFDVEEQGLIVEQILLSRALYIQPGREGDRLKHNMNAPKILVEIPELGFRQIWDDIFHRRIIMKMKKKGLNQPQAKRAAQQFIEEFRRIGQFHMLTK